MTDAQTWVNLLGLAGILVVAYLVTMWAVMAFWTYRDITARSTDQLERIFGVALVALFSAPGFLLYLALRPPEKIADVLTRQVESEALIQDIAQQDVCPGCRRALREDFVLCPYCRVAVQTSCQDCSRVVRLSWVLCPYCGADGAATPAQRAVGSAASGVRVPPATWEGLEPASAFPGFASASARGDALSNAH